jgi:hypothetical protein
MYMNQKYAKCFSLHSKCQDPEFVRSNELLESHFDLLYFDFLNDFVFVNLIGDIVSMQQTFYLISLQAKVPNKNSVVYKFSCQIFMCSSYIGKATDASLHTLVNEHAISPVFEVHVIRSL